MKITDKITITNEDNMELMARYPDNYFDLAIVDPPYAIDVMKSGTATKIRGEDKTWMGRGKWTPYDKKEWDKQPPTPKYFTELFRISKNQIVSGGNYFNLPISRGWIVWDKMVVLPSSSKAELLWSSFDKILTKVDLLWDGYKKCEEVKRIHPTQKPIRLYKWLLDKYAKQGDKILDTHLGSGSIAIACHDYGFELTACELDKDYYDKAIKRIQNHVSQLKLF